MQKEKFVHDFTENDTRHKFMLMSFQALFFPAIGFP